MTSAQEKTQASGPLVLSIDAMGGDDDDGFGAVQMGAPKVKPRAGPGRATMQADDDDEMGGGGDDDLDFARGLSALERAKAARLQAEREP